MAIFLELSHPAGLLWNEKYYGMQTNFTFSLCSTIYPIYFYRPEYYAIDLHENCVFLDN